MITVLAIPVLGETVRLQGWAGGDRGLPRHARGGPPRASAACTRRPCLVVLSSLCWCMAMLVTRRLVSAWTVPASRMLWTATHRIRAAALRGAVLPRHH